jgi:energy-coupling factor transporter ATP-binding protein EcfA2
MHHLYVIGRTGVGKSTLLETLALQDIHAGHGIALIDPHGDLVRRIAGKIPKERLADLVYLDAPDPNQPYGYNPLRGVRADKVGLAVGGLLDALKKLWSDSWGVRMEHILRNALYALIEYGDATLDDLALLLVDKSFGQTVLSRVENEAVRLFWQQEFARYNPRYRQEAIAPIQNKIGAFLADRRLHRILTAPLVDLHFREIMDKGKILLVNLSKGHLGEDGANLLGALLVSTLRKHGDRSSSTSTSFKISPRSPLPTWSLSCANTLWASRLRISTFISWNRKYGTRCSQIWGAWSRSEWELKTRM